jgi:tRNA uridine 5-carbamoylmethylation protein Kti12
MTSGLVLVNGLPGSGKTTRAVAVAATLDAQPLSKVTVERVAAGVLLASLIAQNRALRVMRGMDVATIARECSL